MSKNIGYHTRLYGNNTVKICGGSFGGSLDIETANRLVKGHGYGVTVKPSGTPVFVDKEGREVSLYFTVDPFSTDIGKQAQLSYEQSKRLRQQEEFRKREMLEDLLDTMTVDEALHRLTKNSPK